MPAILGLAAANQGGFGWALTAVCAVLTVRFATLAVRIEDGEVFVRNVTSTRSIPLGEVVEFGETFSWAHGYNVLVVRRANDGVRVTAYPITHLPWVAAHRRSQIHGLNSRLAASAE